MRLFKNVDIINLEKILNEGILSLEEFGNNNWDDGYRADNARDVVYLSDKREKKTPSASTE